MSMVDEELTIVLISAKIVRSVNVVKGRRPVIPKLDMISPYAHTPQVIFCILGKQLLHCICCCLTQPRLVCKSHQQNYNSTPRRPQTDQDREEQNLSNSTDCGMPLISPAMNHRKKKNKQE